MRCLFVPIFLLNISYHSTAQNVLPEIQSYEETQKIKIDSTLSLYKLKDGNKYLNLLPTVSYDALNESFNVGLSLTNFATYFQQKQRNKIELASLESRLNERLENNLDKLSIEIEQFKLDFNLLKDAIELFEIEHDLYSIAEGKYENSEISTEEFLKLKKTYLTQKKRLKTDYLRLEIKAKKIALKTKNDTSQVSLSEISNLINKYE